MTGPAPSSLKQLCVCLCVLLALVFAGTSATKVLDGVQHLPSGAAHHVHSPLGLATIAFEDGHDADHHDGGHDGEEGDDGDRGDQPAHHHHADGGSGMIAIAAADTPPMRAASTRPAAPRQPPWLGLAPHGPERPPRSIRSVA